MSYTHLAAEERHYIATRHKLQESTTQIAKALNRNQATISRELRRNRGKRGYRHQQAQRLASQRQAQKNKAVKMTTALIEQIKVALSKDWSPEQIGGRLKQQNEQSISHETIYQYVLKDKRSGGQLYLHLRRHKKPYRKRYGSTTGGPRGIPNRVDIDQRPEVANQRARLGDWEADTMIGKGHQGALVTLDERKSKLRLAMPVNSKQAEPVTQSIQTLLTALKGWVHTITFDNGKEFVQHERLAVALACDT